MSCLSVYDCAGDKRDNVLVVPQGCYVAVAMVHPFFMLSFVTDV